MPILVTVPLLWRGIMTKAAYKRKRLARWGSGEAGAHSFRGLVHGAVLSAYILHPHYILQWHTSSNKDIPPYPSQTGLTGEQAFNHRSPWGPFLLRPPQWLFMTFTGCFPGFTFWILNFSYMCTHSPESWANPLIYMSTLMIVIIIGKDTGLVVHVSGSQIVSASLHWLSFSSLHCPFFG